MSSASNFHSLWVSLIRIFSFYLVLLSGEAAVQIVIQFGLILRIENRNLSTGMGIQGVYLCHSWLRLYTKIGKREKALEKWMNRQIQSFVAT